MKVFRIIILLYFVLQLIIASLNQWLLQHNIDVSILYTSNIFLFIITVGTMALQIKAMKNKNSHVFVRSVMGSMMLKMFLSALLILAYVYSSGNQFNKKSIFISLFLYLFYLSVEVISLTTMNKEKHG